MVVQRRHVRIFEHELTTIFQVQTTVLRHNRVVAVITKHFHAVHPARAIGRTRTRIHGCAIVQRTEALRGRNEMMVFSEL